MRGRLGKLSRGSVGPLVVISALVATGVPGPGPLTPRAAAAPLDTAAAGEARPAAGNGSQFAGLPTSQYAPVAPQRLVDTRTGEVGPFGYVAGHATIEVDASRIAGRPAGTITAVAVNITAVDVDGPGHLTAWPSDRPMPLVSNLNVPHRGAIVPNFAIVPVSAAGRFSLQPNVASHLVVDVAGVFVAAPGPVGPGRLTTVAPTRLLDTRDGTGGRLGGLPVGGSYDLPVTGRAGIPAGAAAAVVAITATEALAPGFVTVWPTTLPRPFVAALNVPAPGATVTNLAIAEIGAGGSISLFSQAGTHLVVDVVGWMTGAGSPADTAGLFVPNGPDRQLDSRLSGNGLLAGRTRSDLPLRLPGGLPAASVAAVAANITVTETSGSLYLTAYAARTKRPWAAVLTSDRAGQTIGSFSIVPAGTGGTISLYPMVRTHVVVDAAGFFLGSPAPADQAVAPSGPTQRGAPALAGFDAEINAFLQANGYAGAAVAVSKNGRVVYSRAYGSADVATGEPMRIDHQFRIASISKVMTAVAVLQLAEAGQLPLDTRVWPLLDGRVPLAPSVDQRLRSVTVRHLLGHTSGLSTGPEPFFNENATIRAVFGPNGASSCEQAARWYVGKPLVAAPGTKYGYANMNYCLLSLVIEQVTGRPWSDVVRERVQLPRGAVGMYTNGTYTRQPLDVAHATPPPGEPGGGWFMESLAGAGSWMGTPIDVVRVVDGLDPTMPGADLLTGSSLAAMRARPATDVETPDVWYGLGLISYDGGSSYGHTGSLQGSRTMAVHRPDGLTWSIMVNARFSDHGDILRALMDRAIARVPSWPAYDLGPDLP